MSLDDFLDDDPGPARELPRHERDYLIPAKDAQGHSVPIHFRVPAQILRMTQDLVSSKKYPFKNVTDVCRFSLVHAVKQLAAGAGIQHVTAEAEGIIVMLREEELHHTFLLSFQYLQNIVERCLNEKEAGEARRQVAAVRARVGQMPPGYWREKFERELVTRFGRLLDGEGGKGGGGRVSLVSPSEDEA